MDSRHEIEQLQQLFDADPQSDEFRRLRATSKWGERIKSEVVDRICTGNHGAIEDGIRFLEINPRFHRSGYFKGKIASKLKSVAFSREQVVRLQTVLLAAIGSTNVGPEFVEYALLMPAIGDPDFVSVVKDLRNNSDGWQRSRCERLLLKWQQHAGD